jgi:hypothetical protein
MDLREGQDSSGLGEGPVAGFCEHGSGPSGSIKGGEFLKKSSALWSSSEE